MGIRTDVLIALKTKLISEPLFLTNIHLNQTNVLKEREYPAVWIFYPNQLFTYKNIGSTALSSLKGTGLITIRVAVENTDQTPELELDTIIDSIIEELLKDSTIDGTCKTSDIIQVTTDGGLIGTHSIADINIEVQT